MLISLLGLPMYISYLLHYLLLMLISLHVHENEIWSTSKFALMYMYTYMLNICCLCWFSTSLDKHWGILSTWVQIFPNSTSTMALLLICSMIYANKWNNYSEHTQVIHSKWWWWQLNTSLRSTLPNNVKKFSPKVFSSVLKSVDQGKVVINIIC